MKHTHPIILLLSAVIPSHGQDASITTGFAGTNMGKSDSVFPSLSLLIIAMICHSPPHMFIPVLLSNLYS